MALSDQTWFLPTAAPHDDLCIPRLLEAQAARTPDAIAIAAPGRPPLTYRQLVQNVRHGVDRLNSVGLGRNARVALVLPNGPEMAAAFLGVACGATCAPLNPSYTASELEFYLADLGADAVVVPDGVEAPAVSVARASGIAVLWLSPGVGAEAGVFTLRSADGASTRAVRTPQVGHPGYSQPDDVALVLHTSGTTSRPKVVPLTQANLCASAANIRAAYELVESDRSLNVMPLFHAQGLMVTLSTVLSGGSVVCTPGFDPDRFFGWIEEFRPTWYSAAPTIHQAILSQAVRHPDRLTHCSLRFIRSSAAPLPPQVLTGLESVFRAPVIEGYGMTESALHVTSNPLPPGQQKPGSVGIASGAEVGIMDEAGRLLPPNTAGEVVFRGPNVTPGYENNPEANRSAFTHGWLRTGDQGFLDRDGYLYITGRLKEIINRGGEKISPREVDELLLDHPAVAQAVTFAIPHPTLGEDVAAAVVLREAGGATEAELRQFAAERLTQFKVPRVLVFLDELPKGPTGKLQRAGLAERLGLTASGAGTSGASGEFVAARTPLEAALAGIWCQVLGLPEVGIHDHFIALGGHSLLASQAITRLRDRLQVDLSLDSFFEAPTVAALAVHVLQRLAEWADAAAVEELLQRLEAI